MPASCCIKDCRSTWKKNSEVKFYRFPFQNEKILKYWIAATGRNNWSPYATAQICSLHFLNTDYHNNGEHTQRRRLKPDVIPTQRVHKNILQMFQQDTVHVINQYIHNNDIPDKKPELTDKQSDNHITPVIMTNIGNNGVNSNKNLEWTNKQNDYYITSAITKDFQNNYIIPDIKTELQSKQNDNHITSAISKNNQNNSVIPDKKPELMNKQNDNIILPISKCSKCSNYDKLVIENEILRKKIEDLKILQEERLNQQASMFHTLIHNKEDVLKKKLELAQKKNKTLNKNVQRKGKNIIILKTLFKDVKRRYLNNLTQLSNIEFQ